MNKGNSGLSDKLTMKASLHTTRDPPVGHPRVALGNLKEMEPLQRNRNVSAVNTEDMKIDMGSLVIMYAPGMPFHRHPDVSQAGTSLPHLSLQTNRLTDDRHKHNLWNVTNPREEGRRLG
jgi:hypothetical protein